MLTVDNLTGKFNQAKGLVLTDYTGLKVAQLNQLRTEVKKAGGELEVVKNTLLSRAAQQSNCNLLPTEAIAGPTAALWVYKDDPAPLKALHQFINQAQLPKIKAGFWGKTILSAEKVIELASLPGLRELQAKLDGVLRSPLAKFNNALGWNLMKLTLILKNKIKQDRG